MYNWLAKWTTLVGFIEFAILTTADDTTENAVGKAMMSFFITALVRSGQE